MFEPFYVAPMKAKIAHLWLLAVAFLSWVACLVTFEGPLHTLQWKSPNSQVYDNSYDFYWDRPHGAFDYTHYSQIQHSIKANSFSDQTNDQNITRQFYANGKQFDQCDSAGDATLAFAIFSFLMFMLIVPMLICRLAGLPCPTIRDVHQSLNYEIISTGVGCFCFFVMLCSWGVCFTASNSVENGQAVGKGFGLILSCFLFQLVSLCIMGWVKWHTEDWMVGIGANRSGARSDGVIYGDGEFGDSGASAFTGNEQDENLQQFAYKTELPSDNAEVSTYTIAQEDSNI